MMKKEHYITAMAVLQYSQLIMACRCGRVYRGDPENVAAAFQSHADEAENT